jgi:hypothetical protein
MSWTLSSVVVRQFLYLTLSRSCTLLSYSHSLRLASRSSWAPYFVSNSSGMELWQAGETAVCYCNIYVAYIQA